MQPLKKSSWRSIEAKKMLDTVVEVNVYKLGEPSLHEGSLIVLIQKPCIPSQGRNLFCKYDIPSMWGNTKSGVKQVVQGHCQWKSDLHLLCLNLKRHSGPAEGSSQFMVKSKWKEQRNIQIKPFELKGHMMGNIDMRSLIMVADGCCLHAMRRSKCRGN